MSSTARMVDRQIDARPMRGPFAGLPSQARRRLGWTLGATWGTAALPLLQLERRMMATGGPGIIAFELAGSADRAARIKARWGKEGKSAARRSLLLDYPFLVGYAPLLALGCEIASGRLGARGMRIPAAVGPALAWGQLAAGGFDAIENVALLGVLADADDRLPALARTCATAKFALIGAGLAYTAAGLAIRSRA